MLHIELEVACCAPPWAVHSQGCRPATPVPCRKAADEYRDDEENDIGPRTGGSGRPLYICHAVRPVRRLGGGFTDNLATVAETTLNRILDNFGWLFVLTGSCS
ncbi:hypothetical protein OG873_39180 [Streptomyces violaceus]|nr:hypothetical protein [Streptomyces violaceus]